MNSLPNPLPGPWLCRIRSETPVNATNRVAPVMFAAVDGGRKEGCSRKGCGQAGWGMPQVMGMRELMQRSKNSRGFFSLGGDPETK